jgi:rhodanese-related sulfurtransferase
MNKPEAAYIDTIFLILKAVIIIFIGSGAGLFYNTFSDRGILSSDTLSMSEEIEYVTLEEAKWVFDRKNAIFIDARSISAYTAGHIPGALILSVAEFENRSQVLLSVLHPDTQIITYCSGSSCQSSIELAKLLTRKFRSTQVRTFYGGWSSWIAAGYPVKTGDTP